MASESPLTDTQKKNSLVADLNLDQRLALTNLRLRDAEWWQADSDANQRYRDDLDRTVKPASAARDIAVRLAFEWGVPMDIIAQRGLRGMGTLAVIASLKATRSFSSFAKPALGARQGDQAA